MVIGVAMYVIELIRFVPGRVEPEVLARINHADHDLEAAKEKAKSILQNTKIVEATRVRVLNMEGVEVFNWGPDR